MTVEEARQIVQEFHDTSIYSDEDFFAFTEAMQFLIEEEQRPQDMLYLGGAYYEQKRFDLALKYYEMAASFDYDPAYECLGYIWYYGRTGERDYKKAYENFSKLMKKGDLVATYKIADMYKNGYYVAKDQARYEQIIEDLYPKVKNCRNVFDPLPEVFTRLARIRADQGRKKEAVKLYLAAKDFLAQRIMHNAFFGNMNIMKWLIDDLYELIPFDEEEFDFFDLYYLLKSPYTITFEAYGEKHTIISEQDGGACAVNFDGKWYRDRDDFFKGAQIDGEKLTEIYWDLETFRIVV
ncbi:MAG: sel1 repeat family protein [Lachnospiraceae bacterium]|nr:sel1 repeat family protein [Lachnospiraceae bacterium]